MAHNICFDCAACETERCPRRGTNLEGVDYGCLNFTKLPIVSNPDKLPTKCGECRFLFQKPRKDAKNKSYVNCGAVASLVVQIKPTANCPYFKPLRKRQFFKRLKRNANRKPSVRGKYDKKNGRGFTNRGYEQGANDWER